MKAEDAGIKTIKLLNHIVNNALLTVVVTMVAFAFYALWDSDQIIKAADKSNYEIYKPTKENEGKTFAELRAVNPEVIAWLDVYGTNIDYPVTQGDHNMKYVNTSAEGRYSISGAIFLDSGNSSDFSDFNNILYGHHMDKNVMFGELESFSVKEIFDGHRYGNLYYNGQDHGVEFFAFIHADAYDGEIFALMGEEGRQAYIENLFAEATHKRVVGITAGDRIVMLTTCSSDSTNGRDILAGRITDEVFADKFSVQEANGQKNQTAAVTGSLVEKLFVLSLLLAIALILCIAALIARDRRIKNRTKKEAA